MNRAHTPPLCFAYKRQVAPVLIEPRIGGPCGRLAASRYGFGAGPEGLDLLALGARRSPDDDAGSDSEMLSVWWGDAEG